MLLPLEVRILEQAEQCKAKRTPMYGFSLASALSEDDGKTLTAHGTLYKALSRMTEAGYLTAEWEDPELAEQERRPRRRLYRISAAGSAELNKARAQTPSAVTPHPVLRPLHP
jgi:DNA-binding PadR family transcriptional regulator